MVEWLEGKKTLLVGLVVFMGGFFKNMGWIDMVPEWMSEESLMMFLGSVMIVLRWLTSTPIFQSKRGKLEG